MTASIATRVQAADWDAITGRGQRVRRRVCCRGCSRQDRPSHLRELYRARRAVPQHHRHGLDTASARVEYRYFREPYPDLIEQLKQALYPRLLPIARDWWSKLGSPGAVARLARRVAGRVPRGWADEVDRDLAPLSAPSDWNALHRDLYGELVFPLQVVINLNEPGVDHTGGEFLLVEQRPRAQSRGSCDDHSARTRFPLHDAGSAGPDPLGVGRLRPCVTASPSLRSGRASHARFGVPRRGVSFPPQALLP